MMEDRTEAIERGCTKPGQYGRPDDMPPEYYSGGDTKPQQEDTNE